MNNCTIIPCSVVEINNLIEFMPCKKLEKFSSSPIKLADKMDINLKKLVITGWWSINDNPGTTNVFLAIAENEVSQIRRVMYINVI